MTPVDIEDDEDIDLLEDDDDVAAPEVENETFVDAAGNIVETNPEFHKDFVRPDFIPTRALDASEFKSENDYLLGSGEACNVYLSLINLHRNNDHAAFCEYPLRQIAHLIQRFHIPFQVIKSPNLLLRIEKDESDEQRINVLFGLITFVWKNVTYRVLQLPQYDHTLDDDDTVTIIFAENPKDISSFIKDLELFLEKPKPMKKILVYSGGWEKEDHEHDTREDISRYTWDDLTLPTFLKDEIRTSAERFFSVGKRRADYLNVSHKRGILFVGEPGCGKSLTAKIIANTLKVHFIYVMSLIGGSTSPQDGIKSIYKTAAKHAPCIVLFEDLDSQIDHNTRSTFLNILDGFTSSEGVLTIATTNHPENIDPALLDRPSRFDAKYAFPYLDLDLRREYFTMRIKRITKADPLPQVVVDAIEQVSKETESYATAMLQEIIGQAIYSWIDHEDHEKFAAALIHERAKAAEQKDLGDVVKLKKAASSKKKSEFGFR